MSSKGEAIVADPDKNENERTVIDEKRLEEEFVPLPPGA
jgi:hypothetical protein